MDPTRYSEVFFNHTAEFEDVDALLMRDWFVSEEDLDELLWTIRQDVYDMVFEHRKKYSRWIREYIELYNPERFSYLEKLKLKVIDVTEEMEREWKENEFVREMEEYDAFIPPPRPRGDVDDRYDEMKARIETIRTSIAGFQRRPTLYYRQLEQARLELQIAENVLLDIEEEMKVENNSWKREQWSVVRSVDARHRS